MVSGEQKPYVAIIGAGPAGLMAAETLADMGIATHVFDAMPTPARKFLMAGKSGLNITHNEEFATFLGRYAGAEAALGSAIEQFTPTTVRAWAKGLGNETFVGSSGRVFPKTMKASPLLRAWLARLKADGMELHTRHYWHGWTHDGGLRFTTPEGEETVHADAVLLALGGTSWPKLGSDGVWQRYLRQKGIKLHAFKPANCGFETDWSDVFKTHFEGEPIKNCVLMFGGKRVQGDMVVTKHGVEGSAIYALTPLLRDAIEADGSATLHIDLTPDHTQSALATALAKPRQKRTMTTHIKRVTGLVGVKSGLLRECTDRHTFSNSEALAAAIKNLPLVLKRTRPIEEAISVAGGVPFEELDASLMIKSLPGIFCAGEMVDWEAPTGGYLLTACFAQGKQAGLGVANWLKSSAPTAAPSAG